MGIVNDGRAVAERSLAVGGSHAAALLALVEDALADAAIRLRDVDLLAVSLGPGSFTGLRVGVSVAKGLSLATGVPVVGVPTLHALAQSIGPRPGLVIPVLDARKSEVYTATFVWRDGSLVETSGAEAIQPGRLATVIKAPCTLLGDGVDTYRQIWEIEHRSGLEFELIPAASLPPLGGTIAALGAVRAESGGPDDVDTLAPLYVRKCEAEMVYARRHEAPVKLTELGSLR